MNWFHYWYIYLYVCIYIYTLLISVDASTTVIYKVYQTEQTWQRQPPHVLIIAPHERLSALAQRISALGRHGAFYRDMGHVGTYLTEWLGIQRRLWKWNDSLIGASPMQTYANLSLSIAFHSYATLFTRGIDGNIFCDNGMSSSYKGCKGNQRDARASI